MKNIPTSITKKLEERKSKDAFRTLVDLSDYVDFSSNDYLGIAKWQSTESYAHGSAGSRLISGNSRRTEEIEQELADFFGMQSGLIFNSGYDANVGLFSCILHKEDTVIYDQLIHASIRDGIRLGRSTAYSFAHNDLNQLRQRLEQAKGNVYVAVEGIYSMDGDEAPLVEMADLCEEFGAFLIVDEAHSGGIRGDKGKGLVSQLGLNKKVFAKVMTYGKAFGSHGAIILGPNDLRDYLINFARSFLYTTAISPQAQERMLTATYKVAEADDQREALKENIELFHTLAKELKVPALLSDSPIQCLMVSGNTPCRELSKKIMAKGFAVKAILYPTVPRGEERLRICLHSFNTKEEIKELIQIINE